MARKTLPDTRHVRKPRQTRSEETLRRMLEAAEEILRERSWSQMSLAEVARRAGVTIGAFYARFADKDSLLRHLEETSYASLGGDLEKALRPMVEGDCFEDRLTGLFRALADYYSAHRGVARALSEQSHAEPELLRRRKGRNQPMFQHGRDWILASHPSAAAAGVERINTALLFATSSLRERVLFRDFWPDEGLPATRALCRELALAVVAYLDRRAETAREETGSADSPSG